MDIILEQPGIEGHIQNSGESELKKNKKKLSEIHYRSVMHPSPTIQSLLFLASVEVFAIIFAIWQGSDPATLLHLNGPESRFFPLLKEGLAVFQVIFAGEPVYVCSWCG